MVHKKREEATQRLNLIRVKHSGYKEQFNHYAWGLVFNFKMSVTRHIKRMNQSFVTVCCFLKFAYVD